MNCSRSISWDSSLRTPMDRCVPLKSPSRTAASWCARARDMLRSKHVARAALYSFFALPFSFFLYPFSLHAQDTPVFRSKTDLVVVPVTVTDRSGRFVRDLTPEQFEIVDAGGRRSVLQFAAERVPISLGIL